MGLALEVGFLADLLGNDEEGVQDIKEEMQKLNSYLSSIGQPLHIEPEDCPVYSTEMFGYAGIHYLRRIAAHLDIRNTLPAPGDEDADKDQVLEEYFALLHKTSASFVSRLFNKKQLKRNFDHLIFHSDAEGYYLPRDFSDVLFPPALFQIPGGMIGASQQLLTEMEKLAEALELPLDLDPESEEVWLATDSQGEGDVKWKRYGVESFTCLRLYRAAQHSLKYGAAINFC